MWNVEDHKGDTLASCDTEDEAWEFVMRREVNHVAGADKLEVIYIDTDEELIADFLGEA